MQLGNHPTRTSSFTRQHAIGNACVHIRFVPADHQVVDWVYKYLIGRSDQCLPGSSLFFPGLYIQIGRFKTSSKQTHAAPFRILVSSTHDMKINNVKVSTKIDENEPRDKWSNQTNFASSKLFCCRSIVVCCIRDR